MQKTLKTVGINEVIPYENNPRHNDGAVDAVKESIRQCEYIAPIIVDENMVILAGHTRHKALKSLGKKKVEVMQVTGLTDEQKRKYRLLDNKTNEFAEWDADLLEIELDDLDFEGFDFGFEIQEIEEEPQAEEDDYEATNVETRCKIGDLWQLGDHRLICGDSTDVNVIDRLMDGVQADMVMTDPPYGIDAEKMTMGTGAKDFYRGSDWDTERPTLSIALTLADAVCIWGGNYFADELPISNDWLVWWKKNDGLSFSECELAWTNFGINVRHLAHHWGNEKKLHVTMKPVQVMAWAIQQAKFKAEIIVDLFGGSGSTLIACEQLNRKCFMCELDEHYCDVIIDRWEQFTGKKAVLINE